MIDNLFDDILEWYDTDMAINEAQFIDASVCYTEAEQFYITEADMQTIINALKKFIYTIISKMERFANEVAIRISSFVRSSKYTSRMVKLRTQLKKEDRNKTIEIEDIWKLKNTYLKATHDLQKYCDKFSKNQYSNTDEIDRDLKIFINLYEEYNTKLEEISKEKITIKVKNMLDFLDQELSGKSDIVESLNSTIDCMKRMEVQATLYSQKEELLGAAMLPKPDSWDKRLKDKKDNVVDTVKKGVNTHIFGNLKKLFHALFGGLASFVRKWTIRIITVMTIII